MPASNSNGTLSERTKLPLSLVALVLGAVLALSGAWARIEAHAANLDLHHSTQQLDQTYLRQDVATEQLKAIRADIDTIKKAVAPDR